MSVLYVRGYSLTPVVIVLAGKGTREKNPDHLLYLFFFRFNFSGIFQLFFGVRRRQINAFIYIYIYNMVTIIIHFVVITIAEDESLSQFVDADLSAIGRDINFMTRWKRLGITTVVKTVRKLSGFEK